MRGAVGVAQRIASPEGERSGSAFEAPAFVSGLDDVAMMGDPVEQCSGHLGIAKDSLPLTERKVCGD